MAAGTYKKNGTTVLIVILCLCIVGCAVDGVYAYLKANTDTLINEFVPAKVSCLVEENFQDGVKSDVKVRNTGNIDAYIRVTVVATFASADGKVLSTAPREGEDYTVTWGASDWRKGTDGYWYYGKPVAPENLTTALIQTASAISAPEGYQLNMQIIATAIQAAPETAVETAWGVSVVNGELIPN